MWELHPPSCTFSLKFLQFQVKCLTSLIRNDKVIVRFSCIKVSHVLSSWLNIPQKFPTLISFAVFFLYNCSFKLSKTSTGTVATGVGFYFPLFCQVQTLVAHLLSYFDWVSVKYLSYFFFFLFTSCLSVGEKNWICFYSWEKGERSRLYRRDNCIKKCM